MSTKQAMHTTADERSTDSDADDYDVEFSGRFEFGPEKFKTVLDFTLKTVKDAIEGAVKLVRSVGLIIVALAAFVLLTLILRE